MSHLDTTLDAANPGAGALLREHGVADLKNAAYQLVNRLPRIIAVSLNTSTSRAVLGATITDLVSAMENAKPIAVDATFDEWLVGRAARVERKPDDGGAEGGHAVVVHDPHGAGRPGGGVGGGIAGENENVPFTNCFLCDGTLAEQYPIEALVLPSDMPVLDSGEFDANTPLILNGCGKLGDGCPLEPTCGFTIPVLLMLKELGVAYREVGFDLNDKPLWLASVVGETDLKKLSSPCMYFKGQWITDSADIMAALPALFAAEHAARPHVLAKDPAFIEYAVVEKTLGSQLFMKIMGGTWTLAEEHPLISEFAPFEKALDKAPYLSGKDTPSGVDFRTASWFQTMSLVDAVLTAPHKTLNAPRDLPNLTAWMRDRMVPLLQNVSSTGKRMQMLMIGTLFKKMPALAKNIPAAFLEELEHVVELAKTSGADAFMPF